MYASSVQGGGFRVQNFCEPSRLFQSNPQPLFFVRESCAANNARRCSKAPKETPHRIKAPPLCAAHLKKVDENFNLLATLVSAHRRAQPLLRNHSAALPEKDSLYQSFRQAFFKRPRILTSPVRNQNYEKNKSWIYIARMSEESDRHRGHAQRACRCRL